MSATPDSDDLEQSHQAALTDGEVHQIAGALRPYGILDRDALSQACHQDGWQEGGFDAALRKAVADGVIEELPGGFYKLLHR